MTPNTVACNCIESMRLQLGRSLDRPYITLVCLLDSVSFRMLDSLGRLHASPVSSHQAPSNEAHDVDKYHVTQNRFFSDVPPCYCTKWTHLLHGQWTLDICLSPMSSENDHSEMH